MKLVFTAVMLLAVAATSAQATSVPDTSKAPAPVAHKLPLDHGPRATSTPWLNKKIREREAAQRAKESGVVHAAAADGQHGEQGAADN